MEVWAVWHGGASYAPGSDEDLEHFRSVGDAAEEFRDRARGRGHFTYVGKPHESLDTPAVGTETVEKSGPSMWIWLRDPREEWEGSGDRYPDRVMEFGPHGGLNIMAV